MKVGYVRVSTVEQNTARQEVMMEQLGVEKMYVDKQSGKNTDRPALQEMLNFIREGDTVVVESMSRFSRSVKDFLTLIDKLEEKHVKFVSLKENIDTDTPTGRFMMTVFAAMNQLERENILQRQAEGIAIAKGQGKYKGRKPITYDKKEFEELYLRWRKGYSTQNEMMKALKMSRTTLFRAIKEYEEEHGIKRIGKEIIPD